MKTIFNEKLYSYLGQHLTINKMLYENQNNHQKITIFNNITMGNILSLDNVIQTTEKDEFIYHEMLTHIPIFTHDNAKKILIIGGGDGGILREVVKHKTIEKIIMVEIDDLVIDICKKFLPDHSKHSYNDSRLKLIIKNGFDFIKNNQEKFDIIISDSTDPIGPGEILFNEQFYFYCQRSLNKNGIFVAQNGVSFLQKCEIASSYKKLKKNFKTVKFYQACIPTYYGGVMSFSFSSNQTYTPQIYNTELNKKVTSSKLKFLYYNYKLHYSSFSLPQYFLNMLLT